MKLDVMPIYGWGWTDTNGDSVDVPSAFQLEIQIIEEGEPFQTAIGHLGPHTDHPLSNSWIYLSQRHVSDDQNYNLAAFDREPVLAGQHYQPSAKPKYMGFAIANPTAPRQS